MNKHQLTETERSLITMALRDKCNGDTAFAILATDPRLADQFKRQAQMAVRLADMIDEAGEVDVHPYRPDDGDGDWADSLPERDHDRERFNSRQ